MSWPGFKVISFLDVIRIDLHCHLEVTVAQQGHFGVKSTVAQKRQEIRPRQHVE